MTWYYVPSTSCSGYGGFELALRLAGVPARTVAHVERDAYAAATLVARMEEAHLDQAPIWSDLTTFDGRPWRGRVDLVTAGLPCQPFSSAGTKAGRDDERHLWPMAEQLIRDVGPRLVFLENVPDVVLPRYRWLEHVLCDLAALGFDAEWGVLSAGEVGAPHERERFWLLAHSSGGGLAAEPELAGRPRPGLHRDADGRLPDVGHACRSGRPEVPGSSPRHEGADGWQPHGGHVAHGAGEDVADPEGVGGVQGDRPAACWQNRRPLVEAGHRGLAHTNGTRREGTGNGAPEPTECPGVARGGEHPWPPGRDDSEGWAAYIAAGGPEPSVRRVTDGPPPGLADALHLGGNGLVPQVAARALVELAGRLGVDLWGC